MNPNTVLALFKDSFHVELNNSKDSITQHLVKDNDSSNILLQSQDNDEPSLFFILAVSTILSFIDLTTFTGNLLVVISVLTTKSLHTVTNSFIVSLAVADMLVAILVLPLSIYMVIFNKWIFGSFTCDLWIACDIRTLFKLKLITNLRNFKITKK